MIFWISYQKQRQQKQKSTSGTTSNLKSPAVEETINKMKSQHTEWEKIFANHISDKGLISKIYREFIQLNSEKTIKLKHGQISE